jgi:hypothetical protein
MRKQAMQFTWMVLSSVVLVAMVEPVLGQQADTANPQIMILVFDKDRLALPVLVEAERQATLIFRRAGINVDWRYCSPGSEKSERACHEIPTPTQFVMTIIGQNKPSTNDIFGVAFLGESGTGKYVDVFFDRITKLHREEGSNEASLLGAVIAHEIGHLLLGSHSHSQWGIMSPHWKADHLRRVGMGTLLFSPEQAFRMRARIAGFEG